MSIVSDAHKLSTELVTLRRELHRHPEVGLQLPRTQNKLKEALADLPLEVTLGAKLTSIGAVLRGTAPTLSARPTVLLRADMDALPLQELADVDFASEDDGVMHACGHDLHMAMLVGAARLLSERRHTLAGDVVFMFQPGEEGFDGAASMIDEGILDLAGRRADAAYGLHVFTGLPEHGQFATKPDTLMAASDVLVVTLTGSGGHGSAPHLANDPVSALAEIVTAIQTMLSRKFDVFDPVVVTVGLVRAGTAPNVIPESAAFEATVRTFSHVARDKLKVMLDQLISGIAGAHGLSVVIDYQQGYPATVNDPSETDFAAGVVTELLGDERHVRLSAPMTASEDFSRVLQAVPGSFIFLGASTKGTDTSTVAYNHSAYALFDDSVLADGAALYAELAIRRLQELQDAGIRESHEPTVISK